MLTTVLTSIAALCFAILPYAMIRGGSRRLYAMIDVAVYGAFLALYHAGPSVGVVLDGGVLFAIFVFLKLGVLLFFALQFTDDETRAVTPLTLALLAGVTYLLLVPQIAQFPIDGDEPYYLLVSESVAEDFDLDLRNQYATLEDSATGRTDLVPQTGDPVGDAGEQFSRHEPFLSMVLVPGLLAGGLYGALITIVLIAAFGVYSLFRLLEEEGVPPRIAAAAVALVTFLPPWLFYATRIWAEVPAAVCFSEALRGARQGRRVQLLIALTILALLKLRFVPLVVAVVLVMAFREREKWKLAVSAIVIAMLPIGVVWWISGEPLNVHDVGELGLQSGVTYLRGFFGLLFDGAGGLLFQAPVVFIALLAIVRPFPALPSLRLGALAALPYIFLLLPRAEWHGGWSPPLRYVVVFSPLFALLIARMLGTMRGVAPVVLASFWAAVIAIHGIAFPWRQFHIASGENFAGVWLSNAWASDFSRLFPSTIRFNPAVVVAAALLLILMGVLVMTRHREQPLLDAPFTYAVAAIALTVLFQIGRAPGRVVHFEDAHLKRDGGTLSPPVWTVARFLHTGGWQIAAGEGASFKYVGGESSLRYSTGASNAVISIDNHPIGLPATGESFAEVPIDLPKGVALHRIEIVSGNVILDRIKRR